MKIGEFITKVLPALEAHAIEKAEGRIEEGKIKIYWCGTIIRVDLEPFKLPPGA